MSDFVVDPQGGPPGAPSSRDAATPAAPEAASAAAVGIGAGARPAGTPVRDPEAVFQMLVAAHTRQRRPATSKRALMVATVVIPIVLVIGLIIGANYLQHLAAGTADTASAQSNLKSALSTVQQYAAAHHGSFAGVVSAPDLAASNPSLTFAAVSGSATEISLNLVNADVLLMTSLQSSPQQACFGVAEVLTAQLSPVFVAYPATSEPGVYFFEAPTLAASCDARNVTPPPGGSFVSSVGFPAEPLP